MNKRLLNTEIQKFINDNLNSDVSSLLLKGINFKNISPKEIIEQIESKKRSQKKLPTWFKTSKIYYPNKLNIEQTSSELTAEYKSKLISGHSIIDLTGGFGVDCFYFSKQINEVTHCEINTELSKVVAFNYESLNVTNIKCINKSGIDTLKQINTQFDWIYIDPSRRDDAKKKVFLLSDCTPKVKTFQGLFLKYAKHVMIKTSPLLDIKATKNDLKHVKALHIVAVNNDVKELLWVLERNYTSQLTIKTINLSRSIPQIFDFNFNDEPTAEAKYSLPLSYLYEPNSAVLKAGAFNSVSNAFNIAKLHKHSHIYTSDSLIEFPGRRFKIENVIPFNKKAFAKEKISKANVTTRHFPLSVGDIRKKLKIKDGGLHYLFFTTNINDEKIILICSKI
ncbi:RsmD family RNA methyltransferase [uncultured Winogradskyella sp.]|uniref:THUMP-like domain-containing protein n=1 Tax=uncultured Winogradskyella sp. TaxID=395353 RepID=UPI00262C9DAE|nr:RsmD family RNA methyltransferase [uncultured Winogradskyella sp.]